ncbi:hypothetical protein EYC84_007800 [Monilinia fructicola]|uniref:Uncharacterized protein n=1 Tax=Monilinia fructicola TaxID=38448 RepID=A0A5M9JJA5_MONFR|nr:hypothetical protein EYC84_007800 [Monilinia fructicola]
MADSTTSAPKPSSSVKLVLLGEAAVGKSSLEPTIGAAFLTQKCNLPTRTIKFEIWDTAGQERFASLAPMQSTGWQSSKRQASPGIVIALVGNKLDLTNESDDSSNNLGDEESAEGEDSGGDARKVSTAEAKSYAEEEGLLFFETSAKLGTNVTEVFTAIANAIPETSLKGARGPGGTQATSARGEDQSRVNLTGPRDNASKEGCAC